MIKQKKYTFINKDNETVEVVGTVPKRAEKKDAPNNKLFKKELLDLFQRHGYLSQGKDHEVTFRTTSGNIAWISINSIETIK